MIQSFSVIVPVLNLEDKIIRTLESIAASITFFYAQPDISPDIVAEVVIVNEGSTDRTLELITAFSQDNPHFKVINHFKSLGIGPARNTGVKVSQGDILFFCDGDDLFFEEHIYLCFKLLNHAPTATEADSTVLKLTVGGKPYTLPLPPQPVGVVRTGVHLKDAVHPYWKTAIENTIMQNSCIRRDCHEFVEGFPEAPVYKKIGGCEDISYGLWLAKFFKILKVEIETVEYIRYPGNNYDRQLQKFQTPPEEYHAETPLVEQEMHQLRRRVEQDRFIYLMEKFKKFETKSEFIAILNWQQLANEYLSQECYAEAISLYEQGLMLEPDAAVSVKNLLAAAYNNLGSALHKQDKLEPASECFQKAIALNSDLSKSDLARVYYNLGTVLNKQGNFTQAVLQFEQALALDSGFTEAIAALAKATEQASLLAKGYEFSTYGAAINAGVLTQYLQPLTQLSALKVLEIGSGEGRATCWLLDHMLTQEAARITCINSLAGVADSHEIAARFEANISRTGAAHKVRKIAGRPQDILRSQPYCTYHLIYVNGLPLASEALEIAVLSWGLLTIGGVIVFASGGPTPTTDAQASPKAAINAFTTLFAHKITCLHQGHDVLLEKRSE